ncbi:ABC transporter permease [Paenibacillus sp. 598K]|uniref:ABC transporter permease n=1 Tax=Paenibacillus sp. 598K TaxID=1117987 RepID=UPI000FFAB3EA|nr:FtsX-like permease family protein [Paenibacillus sp. 598K]GBF73808.1 ABC transporter permease [Paenibacillus sp. 598K]
MRAVWTLSRAYLAKSKLQSGLLALLILLSAVLITTATLVIANTGRLFEDTHARTNGAHEILTLERGLHDPAAVQRWWASETGVHASPLMRYRLMSSVSHDGEALPNLYLYLMDTLPSRGAVDETPLVQGATTAVPEAGTVWIPTSLAYAHGIEVGDTMTFQGSDGSLTREVSGIVIDLTYGAPFSNTSRVWLNTDDYEAAFSGNASADQYLIALRFDDYATQPERWERFEQSLGSPFLETRMSFSEIAAFYLIIQQVIGFLMGFLSLVMMAVALMTIGFAISDALLAQYRTIGVLQALGLGSRRLVASYLLPYGLLAAVAIVPGFALGGWLARVITQLSVSSLRADQTAIRLEGWGLAAAAAALLLALVLLVSAWYAARARKILPAQAIRYGMSEAESGRRARRLASGGGASKHGLGRLPLTLVIGLRNLAGNRRGAAMMLLLSTVATAVLVLGVVILTSIVGIHKTAGQWGYDDADVAALVMQEQAFSAPAFEAALQADDRIATYGWQSYRSGVIQAGSLSGANGQSEDTATHLQIGILDGSYEAMGFTTLEGSNPRHQDEIAIGVNIARKLDKSVGDTVEVYIEGKKRTLLVSGIYQAIANMSNGARITIDTMREISPDYAALDVIFIQVKDKTTADTVAESLQTQFQESTTVVTQKTLLGDVYDEATAILIYPLAVMGLLFLFAAFVIVYSTCRINIRLASRTYGIYRSIGLTSRRIRAAVALGIGLLAAAGAAIGTVLGVYLLPRLLELVLSSYGLVELPLVIFPASVGAAVLLAVCAALLAAWIASRIIRAASPRLLTAE